MSAKTQRWRRAQRPRVKRALPCAALVGFLTLAGTAPLRAYDCPAERPAHLPPLDEPKDNIDKHKAQLRAYEKGMEEDKGAYYDDVKQVLDDALTYVMSRADKVERPAVVLDIDETSFPTGRTSRPTTSASSAPANAPCSRSLPAAFPLGSTALRRRPSRQPSSSSMRCAQKASRYFSLPDAATPSAE